MKDIDEVLLEYRDFLRCMKVTVEELDISKKYTEGDRAGSNQIVRFCRQGERIYLLTHPTRSKGWYFVSSFETIISEAVVNFVLRQTDGIFGYGISFELNLISAK